MTNSARRALAAALTAVLAVPAFAQEGDPAAGEKVFRKCAACHAIEMDGPNKVGPSLYDVVGRTTGTRRGLQVFRRDAEGRRGGARLDARGAGDLP